MVQVVTEGDILSFTDAPPAKKSGKTLSYGPYMDIVATFVNDSIKVHYVNNAAFAAATQLDRELEVSHWGNIYVEEQYLVVSSRVAPPHNSRLHSLQARGRCQKCP